MAHAADAHDLPAERHRRGLRPRRAHPPHGHGLRHPALVGQAATSATARPARRRATPSTWPRSRSAGARRSRRRPAIMGVVNPNSPLVWDWPDGRRAHRVGGRQPAGDRHAVPAGRRDRAGQHRRAASPSRWPRRSRASRSSRPSGRARRASSGRSSPRSTCAPAGPRSARPESILGDARGRPPRPPLRASVPRRRRPVLVERPRRPGGGRDDEHAVGDDDRRLRPRDARRRLAGGRPHRLATRSSCSTSSSCACSTSSPAGSG